MVYKEFGATIAPSNVSNTGFPIAMGTHIGGGRIVNDKTTLNLKHWCLLGEGATLNDQKANAIGQIWYDTSDSKYWKLDSWASENPVWVDISTIFATRSYVDTAINDIPDPMIFKGSLGTGGTITSLPTASSSNTGFTYKVITAGTYAGQAAKAGDTFISDGSTWVLIPSGDDPSGNGTVTSISAGNGMNFSTITTSGAVTLGTPSNITGLTENSVTTTSHTHKILDAPKWTTARTITLGGDLTGNVSIDGSNNVILTAAVVDDSHNHSNYVNQTLTSGNGMAAWTATNGNLTITLGTPTDIGNGTASAVTATSHTHKVLDAPKWTTARTLTLTGSVTGSVSIDGSGNVNLATTTNHTHDYTYSHTLGSHSDVTITSIAANEILKWNGTAWINNTLSEAGIASSTHGHLYAGSATDGGAATSANKLNTDAGSVTRPVYFVNGIPTVTTYSLGASVPANAVFTDTTYTFANGSVNGAFDVTPLGGSVQSVSVYAHPTTAGNKHIPSGGAAHNILTYDGSSGTAKWSTIATELGYPPYDGATNPNGYTTNTGTVTSISVGNGLTGGVITTSGSIELGTPETLTMSTTNSVTSTSHTHQLNITPASIGASSTSHTHSYWNITDLPNHYNATHENVPSDNFDDLFNYPNNIWLCDSDMINGPKDRTGSIDNHIIGDYTNCVIQQIGDENSSKLAQILYILTGNVSNLSEGDIYYRTKDLHLWTRITDKVNNMVENSLIGLSTYTNSANRLEITKSDNITQAYNSNLQTQFIHITSNYSSLAECILIFNDTLTTYKYNITWDTSFYKVCGPWIYNQDLVTPVVISIWRNILFINFRT